MGKLHIYRVTTIYRGVPKVIEVDGENEERAKINARFVRAKEARRKNMAGVTTTIVECVG